MCIWSVSCSLSFCLFFFICPVSVSKNIMKYCFLLYLLMFCILLSLLFFFILALSVSKNIIKYCFLPYLFMFRILLSLLFFFILALSVSTNIIKYCFFTLFVHVLHSGELVVFFYPCTEKFRQKIHNSLGAIVIE